MCKYLNQVLSFQNLASWMQNVVTLLNGQILKTRLQSSILLCLYIGISAPKTFSLHSHYIIITWLLYICYNIIIFTNFTLFYICYYYVLFQIHYYVLLHYYYIIVILLHYYYVIITNGISCNKDSIFTSYPRISLNHCNVNIYYYIITTLDFIITHCFLFQSPELADEFAALDGSDWQPMYRIRRLARVRIACNSFSASGSGCSWAGAIGPCLWPKDI